MSNVTKQMSVLFPVIIFVLSLNFPQGLALYWVTGTLFMVLQQYHLVGWGSLKVPAWFPGAGRVTALSYPKRDRRRRRSRPQGGRRPGRQRRRPGAQARRPGAAARRAAARSTRAGARRRRRGQRAAGATPQETQQQTPSLAHCVQRRRGEQRERNRGRRRGPAAASPGVEGTGVTVDEATAHRARAARRGARTRSSSRCSPGGRASGPGRVPLLERGAGPGRAASTSTPLRGRELLGALLEAMEIPARVSVRRGSSPAPARRRLR